MPKPTDDAMDRERESPRRSPPPALVPLGRQLRAGPVDDRRDLRPGDDAVGAVGRTIILFVQIATVRLALHTSQARRGLLAVANALFVVAAVGAVVTLFSDHDSAPRLVRFHSSSVLYVVAPVSIVRHIGYRRQVDQETMLGALATYLLIGMAFAFMYRFLGSVQGGPFFGADGEGTMSQDLFFSFVTLTTTGYGNLVPAGNPGQSMAVLEALRRPALPGHRRGEDRDSLATQGLAGVVPGRRQRPRRMRGPKRRSSVTVTVALPDGIAHTVHRTWVAPLPTEPPPARSTGPPSSAARGRPGSRARRRCRSRPQTPVRAPPRPLRRARRWERRP